ncbi:hypothetical protein [Pseudonocardia sp. KRD291]|uniref:hypothetical protein n=1 Tax=Pseudonocardia sp. KRD291 TaxID=2792007 RepID=UPI001C4A52C6|nr:hypothetical protein [Pseudonocardia sp. KRD291]MBW0103360.1 hypothetical protein [Pseudonocardia sp. KRD291]
MTVLTPRPTTRDLVRSVVVAVLAVLQIAVSAFGGRDIGTVARQYDTPLLAAGWAFSIWGLIYLGFLAYAVFALLPAQRGREIHRRCGWWLAASAVLNPLWILAFGADHPLPGQILLIALAVVLGVVFGRLSREPAQGRIEQVVFRLTVSVYTGWTSVAVVLGLLATGVWAGIPGDGVLAQVAAIVVLAALIVVVISVVTSAAGMAGFAGAVVWALAGIATNDRPIAVALVAVVALVMVLVTAVRRITRSVQPGLVALG